MLLTLCFDASNAVSLEKILTVTAMATSTRYRSLVWLSVCMSSVTLMHPAEAVGRSESQCVYEDGSQHIRKKVSQVKVSCANNDRLETTTARTAANDATDTCEAFRLARWRLSRVDSHVS